MAQIISHPFRVSGGRIATVEQFSDQANAEQVAVLVLTRRGERVLVPLFGIDDAAFDGIDAADVSVGLEMFGPDVALVDLTGVYVDDTTQEVVLTYE